MQFVPLTSDLCGQTPLEDAQVDMLGYAINDLRIPFREMVVEEDAQRKVTC